MDLAAFLVSAFSLAVVGWMAARQLGTEPAERYWIFIAAVLLQISSVSLVLSWLERFEPWPFLMAQVVLLALVSAAFGRAMARQGWGLGVPPPVVAFVRRIRRDPLSLAMLVVLLMLGLVSGAIQWATPINGIDERGYHAARAIYWIQHRSILPFETHNDRQTVFPFLAELVFAWPILFLREEVFGRMVFWLAYPASIVGMFLLSREVRLPRRAALAATMLFASTPAVLACATGLKSDGWVPLLVIGAAFFVLRAMGRVDSASRRWFLAGMLLASALAVKTTLLALFPGAMAVAALQVLRRWRMALSVVCIGIGLAGGMALSGGLALAYWNARDHGGALGPRAMRQVHQPEMSATQMYIHAARVPLRLIEFPEHTPGTAQWLHERLLRAAAATGADRALPGEDAPWPGPYRVRVNPTAAAFSLAGLFWLPLLAVGVVRLGRELLRRWRKPRLSRVAALVALQVPLFAGVVFAVRWMHIAPDRFWLAPYALAVPVIAYFVAMWSRRSAVVGAVALLLLVWAVYPSLHQQARVLDLAMRSPPTPEALDAPFQHAVREIPPGSTVLLFANQNAPDYIFFQPRAGYGVRVVPWGKSTFDAERLAGVLETMQITHIFFQNDHAVGFHWAGGLRTTPFVNWFDQAMEYEEIPLPRPGMRLFQRTGEMGVR